MTKETDKKKIVGVPLSIDLRTTQKRPSYTNPAEFLAEFAKVLEEAGLVITGLPVASGEIVRVPVADGNSRDKDGWYVAHDDEVFGAAFGNWKTGAQGKWSSVERHSMTPHQLKIHNQQMTKAREARDVEEKTRYADGAREASKIMSSITDKVNDHPYIEAKSLTGMYPIYNNSIVIPAYDEQGNISTIQFIDNDGKKKFLKGGRKKGCYHLIEGEPDTVYICEGWATGITLSEATGMTVAVAFDAGNLMPVARNVSKKFPNAIKIVAGDDDHEKEKNVGRQIAEEVARELGLSAVFPDCEKGESDFNDIGVERTRDALEKEADLKRFMSKPYDPESYYDLYEYDFLVNKWIIRGYVTLVVAPPAVGKSTLMTNLAVSCCSDNDFLKMDIKTGLRCQIINLEDNLGHINNQIAACRHSYNIKEKDLAERLFVNSTSEEAFHLVETNDNSTVHETNKLVELIAEIKNNKIDILFIDPLVSAHGAEENNNMQMDGFMIAIKRIATEGNCAVVLVHHTGKISDPHDQFAGRGASAFPAKARVVVNMMSMAGTDASKYGLEEEDANNYVRIIEGKNNLAIKSRKHTWFKRSSCNLIAANGNAISLPVFETWEAKRSKFELTEEQILDIIVLADEGHKDGDPYSSEPNATKRWFGSAVADCLDLDCKNDKNKIKGVITQLIEDKHLFRYKFKDHRGDEKWGIFTREQEND